MKYKVLEEKWHIDYPENFRIRFITSEYEKEILHSHEYYEIFLTLTDDVTHLINGDTQILKKHSLVFIRPNDIHFYTHKTKIHSFINLAFSKKMAESLFNFIDDSIPTKGLLTVAMPPYVVLSKEESKELIDQFIDIFKLKYEDTMSKKLLVKKILFFIFSKYFSQNFLLDDTDIPVWLSELCVAMKDAENLQCGIDRMTALSGKTYEHMARMLKKYYNVTPSEFLNNLKLNHAANLLKYSNESITDICYQCGFNSISWFLTSFKNKYGVSPKEFRKKG